MLTRSQQHGFQLPLPNVNNLILFSLAAKIKQTTYIHLNPPQLLLEYHEVLYS